MDNEYFEQEETECTCGRSRDGICHCSTFHQLPSYDDIDDNTSPNELPDWDVND